MSQVLRLKVMDDGYQVARLQPSATIPPEVLAASWFSITRTADELSVVLSESIDLSGPADQVEKNWAGLAVLGPLAFELTGILAGLSSTLADAGISLFAISTFDTDLILVQRDQLDPAIMALDIAGYEIVQA